MSRAACTMLRDRRAGVEAVEVGHGEDSFGGDEPAIILNTFTPDVYVGYFRDLGELTPPGPALLSAR